MSLLSQLQNQKTNLKPTKTVVTQHDGQKFLESFNDDGVNRMMMLDTSSCGYVVDLTPDNVPSQIIDNLYLGAQDCCENDILEKYEITNVLSLGVDGTINNKQINCKFVPNMFDLPETDLNKFLPECLEFIEKSLNRNEKVLIHCNAGVSRSSSIVIAYLIINLKYTFNDAYQLVKTARSCIRPNDGFMRQLKLLENENM